VRESSNRFRRDVVVVESAPSDRRGLLLLLLALDIVVHLGAPRRRALRDDVSVRVMIVHARRDGPFFFVQRESMRNPPGFRVESPDREAKRKSKPLLKESRTAQPWKKRSRISYRPRPDRPTGTLTTATATAPTDRQLPNIWAGLAIRARARAWGRRHPASSQFYASQFLIFCTSRGRVCGGPLDRGACEAFAFFFHPWYLIWRHRGLRGGEGTEVPS
jgi:hypothetical protein